MVQCEAKVPLSANVNVAACPGATGLSKSLLSAVHVCPVPSLLVTVTVVPAGTFSVAGAKAKLWMVMAAVLAAGAAGAAVVAGAAGAAVVGVGAGAAVVGVAAGLP